MSTTSRSCRADGIWSTTRHTDKRAALYTTADRWPANLVSSWHCKLNGDVAPYARHARHSREDLARACRACRRGRHEDAARKLLQWNSSLTDANAIRYIAIYVNQVRMHRCSHEILKYVDGFFFILLIKLCNCSGVMCISACSGTRH